MHRQEGEEEADMKWPEQYSAAAEHEQRERKRVTAGGQGGESRRIEGGSEEGDVARATVVMSSAAMLSAAMRSPATPSVLVSTPNVIAIDTEVHEDEESDEEDGEDYIDVGTSLVEDGRKFRSKAWREYVPVSVDGVVIKGYCKYCNVKIGAKHGAGTSALRNHLRKCKERKEALRVVDQLNTICAIMYLCAYKIG